MKWSNEVRESNPQYGYGFIPVFKTKEACNEYFDDAIHTLELDVKENKDANE